MKNSTTLERKLQHCVETLNWKADLQGNIYNRHGKKIGTDDTYKRVSICVDGKSTHIKVHQFVYYYFTNVVPTCIDHINQDKLDNRFENLRLVTRQQNAFNNKAKGYSWHKNKNKWQASIRLNGKLYHLGLFSTQEEARQAYLKAKSIMHKII